MAIEIDNVTVRYGADSTPVLREVCLELHRGEVCALLGANGAGKSTLVKVIAGTAKPAEGTVRLLGDDVAALSRRQISQRAAVVPQRSNVSLGFTVHEVVAMGRAPHQSAWMRQRTVDTAEIERAIHVCDLGELQRREVVTLSGGEQQRVHIARALAQRAPVLLLDEATAHLDIRHAIDLHRIVGDEVRSRDLCCLCVMHDLNMAGNIANRVVLMKAGRIVADGTPDEVMQAAELRLTFGAEIAVGKHDSERRYFLPG